MRWARKDDRYHPPLPPVYAGNYLLDFLWEVGPTLVSTSGVSPLTHEELSRWQGNIGIALEPWEIRTMRDLSRDYFGESRNAERRGCPAPWRPDDYSPEEEFVAAQMKTEIRKLASL